MAGRSDTTEAALAELFACGICDDVMLDPTTLACCGRSFCRGCLRQWTRTSVHSAGIPRCPGGCAQKLPFRLPARSLSLVAAMEQIIPHALAERIREDMEERATGDDVCLGGFKAWQEVAANRNVIFGSCVGVKQGTPGVIIGDFTDGVHVTVKFDEREDGSELCVNLLPEALMRPLPGGFRLGQRVVALYDLLLNEEVGVRAGTAGAIVGRLGEGDRLMVLFDERVDRGDVPEGPVSVSFREVTTQRPLIGGFAIAQRVQSAMELVVGSHVVAKAGTRGVVLAEFSDTRLTVAFEAPEESSGQNCFNVLPLEIWPWCEPPSHLPAGTRVRSVQEMTAGVGGFHAPVAAGSVGVVLGGVEEGTVLASFEDGGRGTGPQTVVVEAGLLRKARDGAEGGGGQVRPTLAD